MNEIGEILKEARIEQGYTLDDLQQTTKIQKRYLQAIEEGNIDILPGRFYARAFVKQYADIVGLDGEELLAEHLNETSQEASETFAENVTVPATRSTQSRNNGLLNTIQDNLPTILIVLLVVAIFGVIYYAWRQADLNGSENPLINEDNTEQVAPPVTEEVNEDEVDPGSDDETTDEGSEDETEDPDTEEPAAQEISVTESSGGTTTYEVKGPHPDEQTIVLSASGGASWVSINVAGGDTAQQLLNDGDELSVTFGPDTTQIDLVIGSAPATVVTLNGAELEYAPEAANIVKQDLTLLFTE